MTRRLVSEHEVWLQPGRSGKVVTLPHGPYPWPVISPASLTRDNMQKYRLQTRRCYTETEIIENQLLLLWSYHSLCSKYENSSSKDETSEFLFSSLTQLSNSLYGSSRKLVSMYRTLLEYFLFVWIFSCFVGEGKDENLGIGLPGDWRQQFSLCDKTATRWMS